MTIIKLNIGGIENSKKEKNEGENTIFTALKGGGNREVKPIVYMKKIESIDSFVFQCPQKLKNSRFYESKLNCKKKGKVIFPRTKERFENKLLFLRASQKELGINLYKDGNYHFDGNIEKFIKLYDEQILEITKYFLMKSLNKF